jgi:hypothetical protein
MVAWTCNTALLAAAEAGAVQKRKRATGKIPATMRLRPFMTFTPFGNPAIRASSSRRKGWPRTRGFASPDFSGFAVIGEVRSVLRLIFPDRHSSWGN